MWFCLRRTRLDSLYWCLRWSETTYPRPHEALLPFSTKNWSAYLGPEDSNSFSLLVPLWLPWCLDSKYSLMGEELGYKLQNLYPRATERFYSLSLDLSDLLLTNQLVPVLRICLHAHTFLFCLQRAVFFVCSAYICVDSLQ